MTGDEVAAREAIRDLVARYNANGDTGRFDDVVALFAPDAVMELPGGEVFEGRDAIAGMFRRTREQVHSNPSSAGGPMHLRHFTGTQQIDLDGPDRARSRCYFQVLMPHGLDHWGRYVDELVRIDGRWLFAHRTVTVDGRVEGSPFSA